MRISNAVLILTFGAAIMLAPCGQREALAGERPAWRDDPLGSRFALGAGVFAPRLDTQVRRDSSNGLIGTVIDFESTLGMDDNDRLPLLLGYYRFAKKHRLGFQYFRLDRNGDSITDARIRFGDALIPANFPVSSFFNVDVYALNYTYSIIHDGKKELAFNIGLQLQDIETGIAGNLGPGLLVEEADVVAPLPTFGGSFDYAFNDKWILTSLLGVFAVEIDLGDYSDLSGEILQFNTGLVWKAFENVGFALQYNYFNVDVDVNDSDWVGFLKYEYKGPVLAVAFYF
jgi:hypothetical protein